MSRSSSPTTATPPRPWRRSVACAPRSPTSRSTSWWSTTARPSPSRMPTASPSCGGRPTAASAPRSTPAPPWLRSRCSWCSTATSTLHPHLRRRPRHRGPSVDAGRRRPAPARPRGAPVEQRPALPHGRSPDRRVADPAGAVPPPARAARGGRPRHTGGGRGGAARRLGRRGRPAAAHRGLPRRRRLRRGLLHELRGGRPPAPAARARHPHGVRGHRGTDPRRRRLVGRGRPAPLARGVAAALRRHLGWASPAAASLTAATAVNAVVNTGRRLAGRDVDPVATAREELRLIHGGRS